MTNNEIILAFLKNHSAGEVIQAFMDYFSDKDLSTYGYVKYDKVPEKMVNCVKIQNDWWCEEPRNLQFKTKQRQTAYFKKCPQCGAEIVVERIPCKFQAAVGNRFAAVCPTESCSFYQTASDIDSIVEYHREVTS